MYKSGKDMDQFTIMEKYNYVISKITLTGACVRVSNIHKRRSYGFAVIQDALKKRSYGSHFALWPQAAGCWPEQTAGALLLGSVFRSRLFIDLVFYLAFAWLHLLSW